MIELLRWVYVLTLHPLVVVLVFVVFVALVIGAVDLWLTR